MFRKLVKRFVPFAVREAVRRVLRGLRMAWLAVKIKLSLPLKRRREKIRFEVHLAEHCNLNCCGCDSFSPLAEPELVEIEEFRRDNMERMGVLFSHECEQIYLLGGEPLLHPDIIALMKITREHFTRGKIGIITNGILLAQKDADFWRACHNLDISILMTHYPIHIDIDEIKRLAMEFGVDFQCYSVKESFVIKPINFAGKGDIQKNFALCGRANTCIVLSHGRLFTCSFAPNVHHFNKKFGANIDITEADYIDIYQDANKNAILKRLSEPIPMCRYCNMFENRIIKWRLSQKESQEWA